MVERPKVRFLNREYRAEKLLKGHRTRSVLVEDDWPMDELREHIDELEPALMDKTENSEERFPVYESAKHDVVCMDSNDFYDMINKHKVGMHYGLWRGGEPEGYMFVKL